MTSLLSRYTVGLGFLSVGLMLIAFSGNRQALAQKGEEKKGKDSAVGPLGAALCQSCHSGGAKPISVKLGTDKFVKCDEMDIWSDYDMHKGAFDCLKTPLAKTMSKNLGYDVTKAAQCLVCHAVDISPSEPLENAKKDRFYTDDGMSCEACHGFSDKWAIQHTLPKWRSYSPETKAKDWNLLDMRNPKTRAERCSACHVGNVGESKVLTHEMYAAGHPPLVPLEVVTMSEQEPIHWLAGRKNEFLTGLAKGEIKFDISTNKEGTEPTPADKQKEIAWKNYYFRDGEIKQVRDWAVAGLTTYLANIKLIRDQAQAGPAMLDFAFFDCFACHHDLKYPSDRQARGYTSVPGRPITRNLSGDQVRIILGELKSDGPSLSDSFEAALKDFNAAVGLKPLAMGTAKEVAIAAGKLEDILTKSIAAAEATIFDKAVSEKLLAKISTRLTSLPQDAKGITAANYLDYESAQQLTWSAKLLHDEVVAVGGKGDPKLDTALQGLLKEDPNNKVIFYLRRPDSKKFIFVQDRLNERMDPLARFDQVSFRKIFGN